MGGSPIPSLNFFLIICSFEQGLALTSRRAMPVCSLAGLRMEDNSFLRNVPKPKSLSSVGLSDDARAKVPFAEVMLCPAGLRVTSLRVSDTRTKHTNLSSVEWAQAEKG